MNIIFTNSKGVVEVKNFQRRLFHFKEEINHEETIGNDCFGRNDVSGPHLHKIGMVEKCAGDLREAGIESEAFTETEGNPSVDTVKKAAEGYMESGADFIVAIGGGSPLDVAKAVISRNMRVSEK